MTTPCNIYNHCTSSTGTTPLPVNNNNNNIQPKMSAPNATNGGDQVNVEKMTSKD